MDGGNVRPTMSDTNAFGCGVVSAGRARKHSRCCQIGWLLPGTTAYSVGSRPVKAWQPVIRQNKPHRIAKMSHACPIHLLSAAGHNGECSACGAGLQLQRTSTFPFCDRPPSSPGTCGQPAVFCRSRHEVRESSSPRRVKAADSAVGLSTGTRLAAGSINQPGTLDGTVSTPLGSQTKFPGGSQSESFLLLRLRPRWRCDSLCRTLSPG